MRLTDIAFLLNLCSIKKGNTEILYKVGIDIIDSHILICKMFMYQNLRKIHPLFFSLDKSGVCFQNFILKVHFGILTDKR